MIQFDSASRSDWEKRGIQNMSIIFVDAWCAGTEIRVTEGVIWENMMPIQVQDSAVVCYTHPDKMSVLEWAFVTKLKWKWILKSDSILTRCGCSKSFSLKSHNVMADKISLLKSKLSKKPKHTL